MRSILKFQTTAGVRAGNYLRSLVLAVILLLVGSPLADRVDAHDLYTPDKVQQEIDVLATAIGRYENRNRSDLKPSPDRSKLSTEKKSATNAGELFKKAEMAYLAGQDRLAIDEFKSFLFSHPGNDLGALAQIRLAQLYLEQGNSDLARTHLLEARWLHRQRLVSKEKSDDTAENRSGTRSQISGRESAQLTSDGLSGFSKPEISQNVGRPQNAIDQFATDVGDRIFFDSD
ncbi:MAG: tetratricopeptide repeat protein, partial [Methyloligellaceae bacterium]